MIRTLGFICSLLAFSQAGATNLDPRASVRIEKEDGIYHVEGHVQIRATEPQLWEVLTDYDNLETFVPGMISSDSLGFDEDGDILVDQVAKGRFLFFSRKVHLLLTVKEDPMTSITFRQKEGDFQLYEGSWVLDQAGDVSVLTFSLRAKPGFFAPGFLFGGKLQNSVRESLESVAQETYKRETLAVPEAVPAPGATAE